MSFSEKRLPTGMWRQIAATQRSARAALLFGVVALASPHADADPPANSPKNGPSKSAASGTTILTPDGNPAGRAKVALAIQGAQLNILNGDDIFELTGIERRQADAAGRFDFPLVTGNSLLVVTHSSGFAEVKCSPVSIPQPIRLTSWARVEGTYRVARSRDPMSKSRFIPTPCSARSTPRREPSSDQSRGPTRTGDSCSNASSQARCGLATRSRFRRPTARVKSLLEVLCQSVLRPVKRGRSTSAPQAGRSSVSFGVPRVRRTKFRGNSRSSQSRPITPWPAP